MTHLDDGADLRSVMERSLRDLAAPDDCGPAAVASGRRIRRRRRAVGAVCGVAAGAVVAAVVAIPALGDGGGATPGLPAASDVATSSPEISDPATPSRGPDTVPSSGSEGPTGWWDMPSTRMVDVLQQALPDGVSVATLRGPSGAIRDEASGDGAISGTLSGPAGPGAFQILLIAAQPDLVGGQGETPVRNRIECRARHDVCEPIVTPDGTAVGRVSSDTEQGTLLYEAALLGPDGGALHLTVMNSTGEKPGYEAPTAQSPPLTLDQLRALAQEPSWTSWAP